VLICLYRSNGNSTELHETSRNITHGTPQQTRSSAVFLKVGDFNEEGNEKIKGGDRGAKKHQGGENAQPLIDH